MIRKLGVVGVAGLLIMLAGILLVAWESPLIATGIAFVLAGLGLVVRAMVSAVMGQFGMM